MQLSRVRQRWAEGKPAVGTIAYFTDPASTELISLMGFDCVWIDLEHQSTSVSQASQMFRAARVGGADVMARPAKGEFMRLSRLLEAGAMGVIYPRCDDADEAREVVRWAKFAPIGERGFMGVNPDAPYGMLGMVEYLQTANDRTWVAVQIESPDAVEQSRAIAEVEGVDLLFFGPSDYSILCGQPGQMDGKVAQAQERVCRDTLAAGKRFGTYVTSLEQAQHALDIGASLVCYGIDILLLKAALESAKQQLGEMGFVFGGAALSSTKTSGY
jgi:4-hydroxy-2-oxoheptanedioate aldolase